MFTKHIIYLSGIALLLNAPLSMAETRWASSNNQYHQLALASSTTKATPSILSTEQQDANKHTAITFIEQLFNHANLNVIDEYIGSTYIQHNPQVADGIEGVRAFATSFLQKYPHHRVDIKRVLVDNDYVILHMQSTLEPNTRSSAIVDIFRFENGKIVEHWDVIQEVPKEAANNNTMF
jgi:predicted SnoaL-like aldol condensation-catalyzing enzyme